MKNRLLFLARLRNRYLLAIDSLVLLIVPTLALLIRTEQTGLIVSFVGPLLAYSLVMMTVKVFIFIRTKIYRQYWPYASVDELLILLNAMLMAGIVELSIAFLVIYPAGMLPNGFPRSIPILSAILTTLLIGGVRLVIRMTFTFGTRTSSGHSMKPVLIVGAGVAGAMMVKELQTNSHLGLIAVAFVDDDPRKWGRQIHGVPVVSSLRDLPRVLRERKIFQVIIAMPTAPGKTIREVVQACKTAGVESKTIPGIFEILRGSARVVQFRNIKLEDLLRRGAVRTDAKNVGLLISKSRILVTGAGGSIGSELCRQIKDFGPSDLILLGHGETSIFHIMNELREHPKLGCTMHPVVADIRDRKRMECIFKTFKPDVVFHAAAHKHVYLMENNPVDAVTNNVLGTKTLVDLSTRHGVSRFVMVSSDKAVNPTSVMGVTKRIAELEVREAAESGERAFVTVRFGNVLGSRGSVVPLFEEQIKRGGPVTVTHPEIRRFFMTIPEAVQLVLQAGTMGSGGEVFVLDMGEQIKVIDLARDLIRLSGLEEGRDIDIKITGLLPGEKMFEELFFASDKIEPTSHEKILVCRHGYRALDLKPSYEQPFRLDVETLIEAARQGSLELVFRLFKKLVPEYEPSVAIREQFLVQQDASVDDWGHVESPPVSPLHLVGKGARAGE